MTIYLLPTQPLTTGSQHCLLLRITHPTSRTSTHLQSCPTPGHRPKRGERRLWLTLHLAVSKTGGREGESVSLHRVRLHPVSERRKVEHLGWKGSVADGLRLSQWAQVAFRLRVNSNQISRVVCRSEGHHEKCV